MSLRATSCGHAHDCRGRLLLGKVICLPDFATGVIGAGIGRLVAPVLGIPMIGEYGFTLWGAPASRVGAMSLLAIANLIWRGQLRCGPATCRKLSAQSNRTVSAPSVRS